MPRFRRFILFLLVIGLAVEAQTSLLGLDPNKRITQFIKAQWALDDGLPNDEIHAILQTRDGYLWLATDDGLVRFDGVKFDIFNKNETVSIPDNRVTCLYETFGGTLWAGTRSGLAIFRDGHFTILTTADGLLHPVINALEEDTEGNLWVGYQGIGVSVFKKGNPNKLHHPRELANVPAVKSFCKDATPGGGVLAGTVNGLYRLDNGKTEGTLNTVEIQTLIPGLRGTLLVGTAKSGLLMLREDFTIARRFNRASGWLSNMVNMVYRDRQGAVWVALESGGLIRIVNGHVSQYTEKEGLSNDSVICIHEDWEGNLWVGTYSGLNRLSDGKFTTFAEADGLLDNFTWTVFEDSKNNLWIATNGGLNSLRNGRFKSYTTRQGLSSNFVSCTGEDGQGNLWVGTYDKGLCRMNGDIFTRVGEKHGFTARNVHAIYRDNSGNLWVGTYGQGLFKLPRGANRFQRFSKADGNMPVDDFFVIREDSLGRMWFGTDGAGLIQLYEGRITVYNESNGLSSGIIFAIREDPERPGVLWIGTENDGLNFFHDGRIVKVTKEHGLKDNAVTEILDDGTGYFWLGGYRGISRIEKKELYDFVSGRNKSVNPILLDKRDGMKKSGCSGGYQPAGWRSHDGRIWFPTPGGLVMGDPTDLKINPVPPPVYIEQVILDGKLLGTTDPNPRTEPLNLQPGTRKVEFLYTALSLWEPRNVRFKYILEGFEEEWTATGRRKDRIATYTNLPPGQYTFRVIACNNDGIWNTTGASLGITVLPPFWQKWWFIALMAALFGLLSYLTLTYLRKLFSMIEYWRKRNFFGRYRIISRIGSGGMANIFKVQDGKGTKKQFLALKLMKEEFRLDDAQRNRFLKEAQIVDNIRHPHIVHILERGEYESNLYIAMELLEGRTLDQVLAERERLPVNESSAIIMQLLDALSAIHHAGIVHRDLKPANLMLVNKDGNRNYLKVLDFGLAKTQSLTKVTESGMVVGTLNYLSPEQLLNSKYSPASDIYALGVVFYEMLTGTRPYSGDNALDIMRAIFKGDVKEPIERQPGIPKKLNRILMRVIDKKPENRPSADALLHMLKILSAAGELNTSVERNQEEKP